MIVIMLGMIDYTYITIASVDKQTVEEDPFIH
jgi:hypothetical protein